MKQALSTVLCLLSLGSLPALAAEEQAATDVASDPIAAPASDTAGGPMRQMSPGTASGGKGPGGRAITAFDRPGQRGVGGYFAQELTIPSNGKIFFDQRQMVLQVSSYLHDQLFFNTEIEYEHGGDPGLGGEVKLEQAWGEFVFSDLMTLRAGILLIPLGRLNVLHDADFREATTRPLMTRQIIPSTWMEAGVGARGLWQPNESWEVGYEGYVTQGLTDKIATASGLRSARPSAGSDNNAGKALSARVYVSPWLGMEMGLGGYFSPYDEASQRWVNLGALDLQWRLGAFELVGEAALAGTAGGTFKNNSADVVIPTSMGGYYLEGHYSFFPEFLEPTFLGKGLGFDQARFTAIARWGQVDTDFSQPTDDDRAEAVVGLNYRPVPNTAIKVEWQRLWAGQSGTVTDALISSLAMGF